MASSTIEVGKKEIDWGRREGGRLLWRIFPLVDEVFVQSSDQKCSNKIVFSWKESLEHIKTLWTWYMRKFVNGETFAEL